ncbi:MAG: PAS domain S-box protein [Methylovulum sp.]|nr:PAS domain S-box protein [Methylovulum sp.]
MAKPENIAQTAGDSSLRDTDRLLRELRVYQVELEMQNEELRLAYAELEASRDRYVQLYDFSPICYISLRGDGVIAEANLTCAMQLQVERKQLLNRRFSHYVSPENIDKWHRYFLYAKQHPGKHDYELLLCHTDGTPFHAHLVCQSATRGDAAPVLHIAFTDITWRKQAEQAAAAFETPTGIIVTDANKTILRTNWAFSRITGYSPEEAIGQTPVFLRSEVHDEGFYLNVWATIANDGYWQGEIWDRRKNGEIFPVWHTIAAVTDEYGAITHYVGSFTDITAQKQAEKVLREASQHLESQVASSQEELATIKAESAAINATLNVLLKHQETDKIEAQNTFSQDVELTVLAFLQKLKQATVDQQQIRLIGIIESNLLQIVKSYGSVSSGLSAAYSQLTPLEVQVASMVRQGIPTKHIATALNISSGTVSVHRKHIRKKLGLANGKGGNLCSYLRSLAE